MAYTLNLIVMTPQGDTPAVSQIGTFSSETVCQTEKDYFIKELQKVMPPPGGPGFGFHVACVRKT